MITVILPMKKIITCHENKKKNTILSWWNLIIFKSSTYPNEHLKSSTEISF